MSTKSSSTSLPSAASRMRLGWWGRGPGVGVKSSTSSTDARRLREESEVLVDFLVVLVDVAFAEDVFALAEAVFAFFWTRGSPLSVTRSVERRLHGPIVEAGSEGVVGIVLDEIFSVQVFVKLRVER